MYGHVPKNFNWPAEAVEMFHKYWGEGASASYIAGRINAEFGCSITRNAVIGQVTKHKLQRSPQGVKRSRGRNTNRDKPETPKPRKAWTPKDIKPAAPQPPIPTVHLSTITGCIITGPDPIPPCPMPEPEPPRTDGQYITIDAITSRTCCWPIDPTSDHPQWRYCGDVRDPKSGRDHDRGYCTAHWRRSVASPGVNGRRAASLEAMAAEAEG